MISNNRVLVIKMSPYDGLNSSTLRTIAMIKGLLAKGFEIDWLTIRPSQTHVINDVSQYSFLENVRIIYANENTVYNSIAKINKGLKKRIISLIRKAYHYFSLFDYTKKIAESVSIDMLCCNDYEYLISVSDPKTSHIAAKVLIQQGLKYKKWIQYWGDPLVGDISYNKALPKKTLINAERKLFSISNKIVYTSPLTLYDEKKLHPDYSSRMVVVPTAFIKEKIFTKKNNDKFVVGYYGTYHSRIRNIIPLYDACKYLEDSVNLIICGDSDIDLISNKNTLIQPRGDIREYEEITDLFICILNCSGTQIPGKLYHYAATNRPVLVIVDGEYKEDIVNYIKQFNRYYICENDKKSIIDTIKKIQRSNSTWSPCERFSPEKVIDQIID